MKPPNILVLALLAPVAALAQTADLAAGKAKVEAVCAACHGANGVSVADAIPNLAGQKAVYLGNQLRALKDGSRKNASMNAVAAQLSAADIANVAAYFASQPGASSTARSAFLPNLAKTGVTFPENYKGSFVKYHSINFPAAKTVRYYFANPAALSAAKEGKDLPNGAYLFAEVHSAKLDAAGNPVMGSDGFYVADQLQFYTAMARDAGWGKDFPDLLRNDDWNYAVFSLDKTHRAANQADCLACHKPLDKVSYTFTLDQIAAAAKKK